MIGFEGRVVDNEPHRHHAMQVVWSRDGAAEVISEGGGRTGATVVVEGGQPHAVRLNDGVVALLEAQSVLARAIRTRWLGEASVAVVSQQPRTPVSLQNTAELLRELAPSEPQTPREDDPRIEAVLAWLDELERTGRWSEVSLAGALRRVHLSEGRFGHLFSQRVGTPWRSYLVWRRALVAVTLATRGATLTEAALEAGYSDSAHLARQFKGLFGYAPSRALAFSRFVQS